MPSQKTQYSKRMARHKLCACIALLVFLAISSQIVAAADDDLFGGAPSASETNPAGFGQPDERRHGRRQFPGTLFQWTDRVEPHGGPDLSEPLVTDRPDFTEASSTVGRGVAQLEFGYTYTLNNDGGVRDEAHSIGEPLLRYGIIADWLELRIGVFPILSSSKSAAGRSRNSGVEDLYLGLKLGLTPQEGVLPEMALIPQMTVPSGTDGLSADAVSPGLNWIYAWEINDFLFTAGSSQFNAVLASATNHHSEFAQSWTAAYTLTEKLGAYTEWYGLFPINAASVKPQHYFNGGFTYLLTNDMQFDIRAGMGLNNAADDFFVGTGLSVRLP